MANNTANAVSMSLTALRNHVRRMKPFLPVTSRFENDLRKAGVWNVKPVHYESQQEHWLGWLKGYYGPGFYNRRNWNRDAEFAYNHIVCPPMILWLTEASEVNLKLVKEAAKKAQTADPSLPSKAKAIRQVIPWQKVQCALTKQNPK